LRGGAHCFGLLVSLAVGETGFPRSNVASPASDNFGKIFPRLPAEISAFALALTEQELNLLADNDPLFDRKVFAIDILGLLAESDMLKVDDAGRNPRPAE
jgi:hypothetical protein